MVVYESNSDYLSYGNESLGHEEKDESKLNAMGIRYLRNMSDEKEKGAKRREC